MKRTHHARQLDRIDGQPACYQDDCGEAAGYPGRPYSAWCQEHAPTDVRPIIGAAFGCPRCFVQTGTLTDFDRAQRVDYAAPRPVECIDPASLGDLVQHPVTGVWLTQAGLQKRTAGADRLRAAT